MLESLLAAIKEIGGTVVPIRADIYADWKNTLVLPDGRRVPLHNWFYSTYFLRDGEEAEEAKVYRTPALMSQERGVLRVLRAAAINVLAKDSDFTPILGDVGAAYVAGFPGNILILSGADPVREGAVISINGIRYTVIDAVEVGPGYNHAMLDRPLDAAIGINDVVRGGLLHDADVHASPGGLELYTPSLRTPDKASGVECNQIEEGGLRLREIRQFGPHKVIGIPEDEVVLCTQVTFDLLLGVFVDPVKCWIEIGTRV